mmetsp:Transcript_166253/g.533874  ORF Transcript_166253/g.533874 Transcript_166253/m.533874 type:complete len:227 (-) Transcript_166253:2037-2717(-)
MSNTSRWVFRKFAKYFSMRTRPTRAKQAATNRTELSLTSASLLEKHSIANFMTGSKGKPCGSSGCKPASATRALRSWRRELKTRGGTNALFAGGCKRHCAAKGAPAPGQRAKCRCASRAVWSARALLSPSRSANAGNSGSMAALASFKRGVGPSDDKHNACRTPAAAVKTCTFLSASVRFKTTASARASLAKDAGGSRGEEPGSDPSRRSMASFCSAASLKFQVLE